MPLADHRFDRVLRDQHDPGWRGTSRVDLAVTNRQYYIAADVLNLERWTGGFVNGLVATLDRDGAPAEPGEFAVICTGTDTGRVALTVEIHPGPPLPHRPGDTPDQCAESSDGANRTAADWDCWDDVVEFSVALTGHRPGVVPPVSLLPAVELPSLPDTPDAFYRVILAVRGRDRGLHESFLAPDADPVEEHLLLAWPAPPAPSVTHRMTDDVGLLARSQARSATHPTEHSRPPEPHYTQGGFTTDNAGWIQRPGPTRS